MGARLLTIDVHLGACQTADRLLTPFPISPSTDRLKLDRNGEVLVAEQRVRVLRVEHDATVPLCPVGSIGQPVPDEPVFDDEVITGEGLAIEQVSELAVERQVSVIRNLQDPVLDSERVGEVVTNFVLRNLRNPVGQVAAVEQPDPLTFSSLVCVRRSRDEQDRVQTDPHEQTHGTLAPRRRTRRAFWQVTREAIGHLPPGVGWATQRSIFWRRNASGTGPSSSTRS